MSTIEVADKPPGLKEEAVAAGELTTAEGTELVTRITDISEVVNWQELEPHELASIFPKLLWGPLNKLANDIAQVGLLEPIVLYEGKILDGWNRYKACRIADVQPHFVTYTGAYPALYYVQSKNIERRHLGNGQRALIAAKLATLTHGGDRRSTDQDRNSGLASEPSHTQEDAAAFMHTSVDSLQVAKKVIESGNQEVITKLGNGEITLHKAEQEIAPKPPKPSKEERKKERDEIKAGRGAEASDKQLREEVEEFRKYLRGLVQCSLEKRFKDSQRGKAGRMIAQVLREEATLMLEN
jgi:ParB-like chromosome segregation protein Spo0J